jgi:hypothetical protein
VAHTSEEEFRLLILERGEGLGEGVFGPALRIGFRGIFEEARKGGGQIWRESGQPVVERQCGGLLAALCHPLPSTTRPHPPVSASLRDSDLGSCYTGDTHAPPEPEVLRSACSRRVLAPNPGFSADNSSQRRVSTRSTVHLATIAALGTAAPIRQKMVFLNFIELIFARAVRSSIHLQRVELWLPRRCT